MKKVGDTPRETRRTAAKAAAAAAARLGTAAIGDIGNTLDAAPAIGGAGLGGVLFHELLGSREVQTGDALADAARERAEASATWPAALGYVRAPHAPFSVGPDLMRRIFAAAAAEKRATSIHLAEDEEELKLLRDGSGAWPAMLAAMGIDLPARAPGKSPVDYLASLGAFQPGAPPPLLVHMVHASDDDRRIARAAGATVVLCPRSNLHIGGRLPDVPAFSRPASASRSAPIAWPPPPICRSGARWRRWRGTSPACPRRAGWRPPRAAAPRRWAARRSARWPPASGRACWTCGSTIRPRRSSRWSATPAPTSPLGGTRMTTATPPNEPQARPLPNRLPMMPRPAPAPGPLLRFGRMIKFEHTLFALPFALAAAADRRARPRAVARPPAGHRRRHGRRPHGRHGIQPDRRSAHRRAEPADRQARDPARRRSRCAPPGR